MPESTKSRAEILGPVRRLVVKVGTSILTDENLNLSEEKIGSLVRDITALPGNVREVIVVSSGAIAAGRAALGLGKPSTIPQKQATAACGQSLLMWAYEKTFAQYGRKTAQILLTLEDIRNRRRFINARNTLFTLLQWGVIPVVNENDTVAVEEIKFGDNDTLSALVASVAEADLLVLLSDVDGLYDRDPRLHPEARLLPTVARIDDAVMAMAGGTRSSGGTGGMITKIRAAAKVVDLGIPMVIANGHVPGVLPRILAGDAVGTIFLPRKDRLARRKHWILHTLRPRGSVTVDDGGTRAIVERGGSLLAVGITAVEGSFNAGDAVRCLDAAGREFGRGIVNYSAREIEQIKRHQTIEIEQILGYRYYDEVIHRDDLVIIGR